MKEKMSLYWNTIRNLKSVQIKGQIKRRISRKKLREYCLVTDPRRVNIFIPELDQDSKYLSRFDIEALLNEEILLLHERHKLTNNWNEPTASHLWNYNLHYLEFTIPLAVKYKQTRDEKYKDKWLSLVHSWISEAKISKDACEPYTISLRLSNLFIGLELLDIEDKEIYASLYNQYKYLQKNIETALLANHYFENLKGLIIGSLVFNEQENYFNFFSLFLKEIDEQILSDGMHFERSAMYHKIVLEDILRIWSILNASSHTLDAEKLLPTIKIMAEAMIGMEKGFPRTPLFNDSGDNVSKSAISLLKACERIAGKISLEVDFPNAGYFHLSHGKCDVLFDCGDIGPRYMGGHAHNDCLSFEIAIGGKMVFVNSGTGQYQGEMREFFRSTAAHNTIMIDDREQNELWGEHRVGRRISHLKAEKRENMVIGQFWSYQGDKIRRRLQWKRNKLIITSTVKSNGSHIARQFFHLAPGMKYQWYDGTMRVVDGEKVIAKIRGFYNYLIHIDGILTNYAKDFGSYENKQVLEICTPFDDVARLNIEIEILRER